MPNCGGECILVMRRDLLFPARPGSGTPLPRPEPGEVRMRPRFLGDLPGIVLFAAQADLGLGGEGRKHEHRHEWKESLGDACSWQSRSHQRIWLRPIAGWHLGRGATLRTRSMPFGLIACGQGDAVM